MGRQPRSGDIPWLAAHSILNWIGGDTSMLDLRGKKSSLLCEYLQGSPTWKSTGWWVFMISTGDAPWANPWHHGIMAKRSKPKRDFMEVARGVVEQAIGEQMDGNPLPQPEPDMRNAHAVALGKIGGKKGGKARARSLSARRRSEIAKSA